MKLISWNVNGIRSCIGKGFEESISALDADFICLQEVKAEQGQAVLDMPQYTEYWYSAQKKGYSGTAIFAKHEPLSVSRGIGDEQHDNEGRVLTLEYDNFYLVNCYTPNSKRELLRLDYRMEWEDAFRAYLLSLDAAKPVILCGDLNVAHQEIDIKNAKSNHRSAGFTDEERQKMTELQQSGFADTFRRMYPDRTDAYTWWSYMGGARARNVGWRIDYFIVSERIMNNITAAEIYPDITGSDHCPVGIEIEL